MSEQHWYRAFVPPRIDGTPTLPGRYVVKMRCGKPKMTPTPHVCPMCSTRLQTSETQPTGRIVKVLVKGHRGVDALIDPTPPGLTVFWCRECKILFMSVDPSVMERR